MTYELATTLANFTTKGYVIAPAGYGKTHLIALAVKQAKSRQLILTHTFAGVNSIKTKMGLLGVQSSNYQVDTIASWTLRLCLAYPKNSEWKIENPTSGQWNKLYDSCEKLIQKQFIKDIIRLSYTGIYVDEYQDCSVQQHTLISVLSEFLPCRILGDPLQAIFGSFEKSVDWDVSIYPHFECLGQLDVPWRWNNAGAPELGNWLNLARKTLLAGEKIDLTTALPKGLSTLSVDLDDFADKTRLKTFHREFPNKETVMAIQAGDQRSKSKTHILARSLTGKFSSIEEVEGKDLFQFVKKLHLAKSTNEEFLYVLEFLKKCITGVDGILVAGTRRGEVAQQSRVTKYPEILNAANNYLINPTSQSLRNFLYLVKEHPETNIFRRDLLNRFFNILRVHILGMASTIDDAAQIYQREFRHAGRPLRHSKLIGTTLLVKGLEFDHAIVIDANSLDAKQLYVAITRGAKTLTILTNTKSPPNLLIL